MPVAKQLQIETFAKYYQCDVLHLQEANIDEETISSCNFLQNSYNIFENNSINKYGTASLVKSELIVDNLRYDSEGRVIIFDIGNLTLPLNSHADGSVGGDFNCIVEKRDATNYPDSKMSKGLKRLIQLKCQL